MGDTTANLPLNEEKDPGKGVEGGSLQTGSRWSRHETMALLRVRSEMDALFKDCSVKAPLWDDVSRKLGELGYERSAKKCKEKFENIYKYHKRTKGGRSEKTNGKRNYRFFEQLEALDSAPFVVSSCSGSLDKAQPVQLSMLDPLNVIPDQIPFSGEQRMSGNSIESNSMSQSSSSEESEGARKKKYSLTEFVENLMLQLIQKQESMQQKFLDALEKCERDRIARDEAWKMQEMERIKRERDLLAQERSIVAAKDAAMLSFLQKLSGQGISVQFPGQLSVPTQLPDDPVAQVDKVADASKNDGLEGSHINFSRWPKEEIEALIRLRTTLDWQYQESSPKGPLWEEISAEMKKLGYDRSAKRCKEKWENMNKYFKRVKESNKRRPEDSRTCPYFSQLDALYKDKIRRLDKESNGDTPMLDTRVDGKHVASTTTDDQESESVDPNQEESREVDEGDGFPVVSCDPSSFGFMQC